MKIQIQRIGRSEGYNPHTIDHRLMEGTIKGSIRPGIELDVQFNKISEGAWHTTKIVRVEYQGERIKLVYTKNSIYLIIRGWRREE